MNLRLRHTVGVVFVVFLLILNVYFYYQLYGRLSREPRMLHEVRYNTEELLSLKLHDKFARVYLGKPFVVFMGTRSTPVRILFYNLTYQGSALVNMSVVHLDLFATNFGEWPQVVFQEEDLWYLEAGYYRYQSITKPELTLQPLQAREASVEFLINSSAKPSAITWIVWSGAGWSKVPISLILA